MTFRFKRNIEVDQLIAAAQSLATLSDQHDRRARGLDNMNHAQHVIWMRFVLSEAERNPDGWAREIVATAIANKLTR